MKRLILILSVSLTLGGCGVLNLPCGAARMMGSIPVVGAPALLPGMACGVAGY